MQLLSRVDNNQLFVNDTVLRDRVLSVYFDNTRYLKSANIFLDDNGAKSRIVSHGKFSVPESCYIESTGHFNSVEFNICYNQIMYDAIAHATKYELVPQFCAWGTEGFFSRQLPDILITSFNSRFTKPVNSVDFSGEFTIHTMRLHNKGQPFLFIKTGCRFFDDEQGEAVGEVDLAILNP
ncbi:FcoT family thioesterase [Halothiobacillus neapolitanus]|uniref:(2E)-enoyl-[ACP] glycyltransferase n=1 Tax=Halothiobacillus neapolitanus (strain ATCC 23641 / DSM 15147 / CIP 104769 / NCIMB 8539 / c2) TaxID=555778 RepID=D0KZC1_HALNC|nr:FcoT family thioesterase [Halothiobacillus neapolitanus]ACX95794.1 conserved hypothetical protein [Halothiobacillus neapolitanus c2]